MTTDDEKLEEFAYRLKLEIGMLRQIRDDCLEVNKTEIFDFIDRTLEKMKT